MNDQLLSELFEVQDDELRIKHWIAEGAEWLVADAFDPKLRARIGCQDLLLANNFLIHMKEADAADCFAKLVTLMKPGGILVCRGVDLDVREKAVMRHGLTPVATRIEEIHNADPEWDARKDWPWRYWALEPMNKTRRHWVERYAAIFRLPVPGADIHKSGQCL